MLALAECKYYTLTAAQTSAEYEICETLLSPSADRRLSLAKCSLLISDVVTEHTPPAAFVYRVRRA
jgi:hypothetical protein